MERSRTADGVSSAKRVADGIWNATKLMLAKANEDDEDDVLEILISRMFARRARIHQSTGSSTASHKPVTAQSGIHQADTSLGRDVSRGVLHRGARGILHKRLATPPRVRFADALDLGIAAKDSRRAARQPSKRATTWTNADSSNAKDMPIVLRATGKPIKYKCPQCPQTMQAKPSMQIHIGGHGAVGKFRCDACSFATDSKTSFTWHGKAHLKPLGGDLTE